MRLEISERTLRLRAPFETSYGTVGERELLVVSLAGNDGVVGHGEAAPLQAYDGVSIERVREAIERYRPVLARSEDLNGAQVVDACREVDDLPQAFAAIDLALWDRAGRRTGRAIAAMLTDRPASVVPVNQTISAKDRSGAAEQAARAAREGFSCVKVKVGVGDDAGRVAAVRAACGQEIAIRLDANGAWSVREAVATIGALSAVGLELVEEPCHGLAAVREVREQVPVRIAIDETAAEAGALSAGVADAVCLKISRCGGISGLLAAAALVRASGAEVYLASTFDGPLGIAAALHVAAALASRGAVAPCGLNTLSLFADLDNPLPTVDGQIRLPTGGGLGVDPV